VGVSSLNIWENGASLWAYLWTLVSLWACDQIVVANFGKSNFPVSPISKHYKRDSSFVLLIRMVLTLLQERQETNPKSRSSNGLIDDSSEITVIFFWIL
jgi:hypothetical protein